MRYHLQIALLVGSVFSTASGQISWQAVNNGLGVDTLVRALVVRGNGDLFAGTSEGGYRSTNHGNVWTALIPPGTIEVQTLALDQAHVYAGTDHGIFLSTDFGASWGPINNGFPDDLVLAISINNSGHVFGGTDLNGLYRSTNFGSNWSQLTNGLTSPDMTALAYRSPSTIFAGTDGAGIFVSTNNGDSWTQSNTGLGDLLTRSITMDHSGNVFVGTNTGGLFRSTNAGLSWTAMAGLSTLSIVSLCTHPNGDLYAGTPGDGVFRSTDNGATWSAINSGLTNLFVYALAVDSSRYVYAGTAGGGVFRTAQPVSVEPDHLPALPASYALVQNFPNPFNPYTTVRYALPRSSLVTLIVYNTIGQQVARLVNEEQQAGYHAVVFRGDQLASGVYFCRLDAGPPERASSSSTGRAASFTSVKKLLLLK